MQIFFEKTKSFINNIEIVERKGIGHPDSVIDGICEAASRELSKFYMDEKGFILHHNLDKGLIVGGVAQPVFGGGKIIQPPEVIVAGTASIIKNIDDIRKLLYDSTIEYIEKTIINAEKLSPEIKIKIHPGSTDLVTLYQSFSNGDIPLANDTSFGVGFYPLTKLEKMILDVEKFLNDKSFKKKNRFLGEDIKVMGVRNDREINITVAAAFVSEFVHNKEDYYDKKMKIKEKLEKNFDVKISINTADSGENIYLTVSGVSWENGDDGQVGRGNRCNGLITPFRFTSLEAVAGKNPVSHVGKIYNLLATELSKEIYEELKIENEIILLSQIGRPIDEPFVGVRYVSEKSKEKEIKNFLINNIERSRFSELTEKILKGELKVF
ncbi:MAG: methionine adenosyltransferase [Candidatus Aenigmarchaeota archaeon]|nr:methionine adenosyltransferase [Candidatus Aenigmarchaeota archaeon]MBU5689157.1 methionine adenosyltransferase [Candidatus Aenigmarchaeota archaeon]